MTDADNVMNPQHFETDPADIQIWTWINLEVPIRIPDHFWSRLRTLAELIALSEHSLV